MQFSTPYMALHQHRKTRQFKGSKVREGKSLPLMLKPLPEKLLNRNVVLASVVQENNKSRVQALSGAVTSFKKPKTSYLIKVRRDASRQITATISLRLSNSTLGFLETKNWILV